MIYVYPTNSESKSVWVLLKDAGDGVMVVRAFSEKPEGIESEADLLEIALDVVESGEAQ